MPEPLDALGQGASLVSIADILLSRGSDLVAFVERANDSEKILERLKAEISPLCRITTRLRDKLQSHSGGNLPFNDQMMEACDKSGKILAQFKLNLDLWVEEDDEHSVWSSMNVAFRYKQFEATMAELGNWRGIIELAMTASILVQGERQAIETAQLTNRVNELLRSVEEQKQTADANSTALQDHLETSKDLKEALEHQKESAEVLAQLCNKVKSKGVRIEANFGAVILDGDAEHFTGIVTAQAEEVRQHYNGLRGSGNSFGVTSWVGPETGLIKMLELRSQNNPQKDNRGEGR